MVAGDTVDVRVANLPDFVGPARFTKDRMYESTPAGTVAGLAWTSMGGATLYVETALEGTQEGKGQLKVTGNLKDVMRGTTLNMFIQKYREDIYNTTQVALYNTQHSFFERAMDLYKTQLSKIFRNC